MADEKPAPPQNNPEAQVSVSRADRRHRVRNDISLAHPVGEAAWMADILDRPWRIFYLNTIAGIGRGLGFAIGVTILAGVVLTVGYRLARRAVSLPWVGHEIALFLDEVEQNSAGFRKMKPQ